MWETICSPNAVKDQHGNYIIDVNPKLFSYILDFVCTKRFLLTDLSLTDTEDTKTVSNIRTRQSEFVHICSGGIKGGHLPPSWRLCPLLAPPQSEDKNGQNQPLLANFWIFAPSEMHFSPSMPPPPQKNFWCRHCVSGLTSMFHAI